MRYVSNVLFKSAIMQIFFDLELKRLGYVQQKKNVVKKKDEGEPESKPVENKDSNVSSIKVAFDDVYREIDEVFTGFSVYFSDYVAPLVFLMKSKWK
jgi:hypothetical protein